ncbi:MAG TPA: hypothetical protein VL527_10555 [Dongiaceae bacterium]|jgi:hypothetical protein|nr:hypothetical protein [Dongiaceae bacterium]
MKLSALLAILILAVAGTAVRAAELKLEAQLVWASNQSTSPNPKHKPVEPEIKKKLESLPLKWSYFYEVKRQEFSVSDASETKVELSGKCQLEVRDLGDNKVEISLCGDGKVVWKGAQALPKKEILVLGGKAPGDTGWLVTIKRIE